MIETLLQLRFASQMSSVPAAFYLAGKEASVWLDEIAKWNAPHSSIRLLPIASSAADRSPRGVLIYALQNSATSWGASKSCLTYRRIGERLFLPADGCIEPSVSDQEIDALLAADYTYVWHPVAGLVAFEASDVLSVSDLIRFEVPRAREWNLARPGVVLAQQLTALFAAVTPTVDDIMNEGQDDIGTDSSPLSELPPSPAEPDGGILNSAARQGKRMLANISQWITRQVPHTGSRETWVNRLEDWAERQLNSYASGLDAARNKEIERLMHMLESDPDRGLRHALPLSGDAHRGNAPPGVRLGERIPDFSLGRARWRRRSRPMGALLRASYATHSAIPRVGQPRVAARAPSSCRLYFRGVARRLLCCGWSVDARPALARSRRALPKAIESSIGIGAVSRARRALDRSHRAL